MKKAVALIAALALFGAVFAQAPDYADNGDSGNSASLTETVNITIPPRVALHLTDTGFDLDLGNLAASLDEHEGLECFLVRKDDIQDFTSYAEFTNVISDYQVSNYPAVVFDEDGNVDSDEDGYLKGGLACSNHKIIQKFSNYDGGWYLTATVNIPTNSGIQFGIMDSVENNPNVVDGDTPASCERLITYFDFLRWRLVTKCIRYGTALQYFVSPRHPTYGNGDPLELDNSELASLRSGRTDGWLDDYITEWFYFDGSEVAGQNYAVNINFTLTGRP